MRSTQASFFSTIVLTVFCSPINSLYGPKKPKDGIPHSFSLEQAKKSPARPGSSLSFKSDAFDDDCGRHATSGTHGDQGIAALLTL
jgi:hypothetical protein